MIRHNSKELFITDTQEYKVINDKKTLGSFILLIAFVMQIFAFVKLPGISTIHAYTIGIFFGYFNPLFYFFIMFIGIKMIFGNRKINYKWFKLNYFSYWFTSVSLIFTITTCIKYSPMYGPWSFGIKPWQSFIDWFSDYSSNNIIPNNNWGGVIGAFSYSFFATFSTSFGANIIAISSLFFSSSLLLTGTTLGLYKLIISRKANKIVVTENYDDSEYKPINYDSLFVKKSSNTNKDDTSDLVKKSKTQLISNNISNNPLDDPFDDPLLTQKINIGKKPLYDFLESPKKDTQIAIQKEYIDNSIAKINHLFEDFKINAKVIDTISGPTLTKFIIKTANTVNLNKISKLENNFKMSLEATDIRLELPIPGQAAIGIEVPNKIPQTVYFKEVYSKMEETHKNSPLAVAFGKKINGDSLIIEINKTPHLLIAGATGSGKSVGINSIIASIMMRSNPNQVQFILIDPKIVEFAPYEKIPHLYRDIATSSEKAIQCLKEAVELMENRYKLMAENKVRKIEEWNDLSKKNNLKLWPYIVIIIDELADLMTVAKKNVEVLIQRITQKARAAGIHLIVATQRPSTDVITGVIKANIPSRISFAVTSSIDSKVILDSVGAEKLIGKGDMLVSLYGQNTERAQGVFLSNSEISQIVKVIK